MDNREWVSSLRLLNFEQIIDLHFKLQEKIKKHYKLRGVGNNLELAIQLCEQHVAMAGLALPALKEKHNAAAREFESSIGKKYPVAFHAPGHHGYRQLIIIMKKRKDFHRVQELEQKMALEGWAF